MTPAVPFALDQLVKKWREAGSPPQPPIQWPRSRWLERFERLGTTLAQLPDELDRATVRQACLGAKATPEAAERAFLVSMVWGYGAVGYGPWRVARILAVNRGPDKRLHSAALCMAQAGPLAAYDRMADYKASRLRYLGPAFGTKYLAFCSGDAARPALILDRLVSRWLRRTKTLGLDPVTWNGATYMRYLDHMYRWADALNLAPDELECRIFSAEADAVGGQWASSHIHQPGPTRRPE